MKSNKLLIVLGVVGLLIIGALAYFFIPSQSIFGSGEYIQSPTFYYYECSPASAPVESTHVNLETGSSGWINAPENTDQWDLWISQTESTKWYSQDRRVVYQICHTNGCDPQVTITSNYWKPAKALPSVHIPNLLRGDKVFVNYQYSNFWRTWIDQPNGAEWYQTYKPFILWKVDMFGGGRTEHTSVEQGCNFLSSDKSGLLNSIFNSKVQINAQSSSSNTKLDFYKTRNMIGTYIPISTENVNFVNINGQDGYCANRQVFSITTANTNGGTYNIVDSNFNTLLKQSVECCPNEKEPTRICGEDFKWKNIAEAECSAFKPCQGNSYQPSTSSSTELVRYNCVNSQCVEETKKVDCTLSSDCSVNEVCDTKLYQCINVKPGEVTENITLPNIDCKWYQEPKPAKTTTFLGFKTEHPARCVTSSWIIYVGIAFLLTLIVLIMILYKRIIGRVKRK